MSRLEEHDWVAAFVDEELDLVERLDMERRSAADAALRRQVDELRDLRGAIRGQASRHAAPPALRRRLAAAHGMPPAPAGPVAARPSRARGAGVAGVLERWLAWRPLMASFTLAGVAMVAGHLAFLQRLDERRLADDVVASHVRSTLGEHLVDVASSDHHQVKPFLSARVGFSPPVGELSIPGSSFVGGRVDVLEGRPVAALVYRQGAHVVNAFVWPTTEGDRAPAYAQDKGFRTAHWNANGMTHWVVSDVEGQEFRVVVDAVRRAGE